MNENGEKLINLEEIRRLSSEDLKKKILEWIDENGISEQLHSRLRHDLIENFNKTALGRRIEAQFQSEYRMILSPLILALNTLVAEFLYAQNCHYSLSVFCTEIPYKNTLPEFEKQEYFRFNKKELNDIFEALGVKKKSELSEKIASSYFRNNNKGNNSLLFFLIKHLFAFALSLKEITSATIVDTGACRKKQQTPQGAANVDRDGRASTTCVNCEKSFSSLHSKNVKYLNKYLISMTKKIKEISQKMERLEIKNSSFETKDKSVENLENLNKSLEKLTNEIRQIDQSTQSHQKPQTSDSSIGQFSEVIKSINGLSEKFEICTSNFQLLLGSKESAVKTDEKSITYSDWIIQLKESRYGQKFLKKLENTYHKEVEKEKASLEKSFAEKLEKEKSLIKLHYRQKFLEQLNSRLEDGKVSDTQREMFKEMFEKNMKILESREKEINAVETIKNQYRNPIDDERMQKIQNEQEMRAKRKIDLTKHSVVNINIEPSTHHRDIIEVERIATKNNDALEFIDQNPVEYLILDAKKRLCDLEHESEQLDQSFQNYLQRQSSEKTKYKLDVSQIMKNYDYGRQALAVSSYQKFQFSKTDEELFKNHPPLIVGDRNLNVLDKFDNKLEVNFENPFKGFNTKQLLEREKNLNGNETLPPKIVDAVLKETTKIKSLEHVNLITKPPRLGQLNSTKFSTRLDEPIVDHEPEEILEKSKKHIEIQETKTTKNSEVLKKKESLIEVTTESDIDADIPLSVGKETEESDNDFWK